MANEVLYEERDQVAVITLNRPERMNSINGALRDQMVAALVSLGLGLVFIVAGFLRPE